MVDYLVVGLGYLLLMTELLVTRSGILASVAIGTLLVGAALLLIAPPAAAPLAPLLLVAVILLTVAFALFLGRGLATTQGRLPLTGREGMLGRVGVSLGALDPVGQVQIAGEIWRAEVAPGFDPIPKGEPVQVIDVNGLTVMVAPTAFPVLR